jgi:hypothetical protein
MNLELTEENAAPNTARIPLTNPASSLDMNEDESTELKRSRQLVRRSCCNESSDPLQSFYDEVAPGLRSRKDDNYNERIATDKRGNAVWNCKQHDDTIKSYTCHPCNSHYFHELQKDLLLQYENNTSSASSRASVLKSIQTCLGEAQGAVAELTR